MGREPGLLRALAFLGLLAAVPARAQIDEDIGLRLFDGVVVDSAAVQLGGPSPLKYRKAGDTYGVKLVDPADSKATKLLIRMPDNSVKAVKRYTPCDRSPLEPIPAGGLCLGNGMCDKAYPGIEFHKRHLWSNKSDGPPAYFTPVADRQYFLDDIVEEDTGPLPYPGPTHSYGIDCGDGTSFTRACREWGYGSYSQTYDHNMASPADNGGLRWNGTKWINLGFGQACGNKRLLCSNPLPQCSNGYDDDGDCSSDHNGARG